MTARDQLDLVTDRVKRQCHQVLEMYQERHFSSTGDDREAIARIAEELGELSRAERNGEIIGEHGMLGESIDVATAAVLMAAGLLVRVRRGE